MLAVADSPGLAMGLEIVLWASPAVLAMGAGLRAPSGENRVWWIVALACAVITVDKAFDFQIHVYRLGKQWVRAVGPGLATGGGWPAARLALLGALFLAGCGALYWLVRTDRSIDRPKRLSLLGLVLVMAYLGARLVPDLRGVITSRVGTFVELSCWLLVVAGAIQGLRRRSAR